MADSAAAPEVPAPDASASPEAQGPEPRGFVWNAFDGNFFFSLGYLLPGQEAPWTALRGGLLAHWNPSWRSLESRLSLAGILLTAPWQDAGAAQTRLSKADFDWDEIWLKLPFMAFTWPAALQAGAFRWSSHPDAALSGEYLARWGSYPTQPIRLGRAYEPLDSLTTLLTGLRFALASPGRAFSQEILAFVDSPYQERDINLMWSVAVAPLPGLEAGFAARLTRPWYPARYAGSTPSNGRYVRDTTTGINTDGGPSPEYVDGADTVYFLLDSQSESFSLRTTVDIATLITGASRADRGGRLYGEAALLGWEDQPILYGERGRRLQFTAGVHLPAFGLLHVLRLQAERRTNSVGGALYSGPRFPILFTSGLDRPWHAWNGQVFLSRTFFARMDVQARALVEQGWEGGEWRYGGPIPIGNGQAGFAEPSPSTEVYRWTYEARLSARF